MLTSKGEKVLSGDVHSQASGTRKEFRGPFQGLEPKAEAAGLSQDTGGVSQGSGKVSFPPSSLPCSAGASSRAWPLPASSTPTPSAGWEAVRTAGLLMPGGGSQSEEPSRTELAPAPSDIDVAGWMTSLPC